MWMGRIKAEIMAVPEKVSQRRPERGEGLGFFIEEI